MRRHIVPSVLSGCLHYSRGREAEVDAAESKKFTSGFIPTCL